MQVSGRPSRWRPPGAASRSRRGARGARRRRRARRRCRERGRRGRSWLPAQEAQQAVLHGCGLGHGDLGAVHAVGEVVHRDLGVEVENDRRDLRVDGGGLSGRLGEVPCVNATSPMLLTWPAPRERAQRIHPLTVEEPGCAKSEVGHGDLGEADARHVADDVAAVLGELVASFAAMYMRAPPRTWLSSSRTSQSGQWVGRGAGPPQVGDDRAQLVVRPFQGGDGSSCRASGAPSLA